MRSAVSVASGLLALLLPVAPAAAWDGVYVVAGDAVWHAWQNPSTAQVISAGWGPAPNIVPGTAFWNNWSIDSAPAHQCNIGYWLSGTGGCTAINVTSPQNSFLADSPNTGASYLGDATTGFTFVRSAGTHVVEVTMRVQTSTFSANGGNEFGWFDASAPSVLKPLFAGSPGTGGTPRGSVATFVPSASYGFYLKAPTGTYRSSGEGDSRTHFVVFQVPSAGRYVLGLEDLSLSENGDFDYNDLVIYVNTEVSESLSFQDDPLQPRVTPIRGAHIAELRQRIDQLRLWHGLAAAAWTDASLTPTVSTFKAVHLLELRSALGEVYVAAGRTAPTYTRTTLTAGTTIITAVDVSELRAAVVAIW